MEGGRLVFGWRGWQESLGVGGEVLAAVGGVEAFGEDDEGGAGFGGFEDFGSGAGEIDGFVGAWGGYLIQVDIRGVYVVKYLLLAAPRQASMAFLEDRTW